MKYITFTVPCYNSEAYMEKCVDSLLKAGTDAEIIIVDDGSKDGTAAIADGYAEKYPDIVRVIHKENGGHGSGVNCGLEHAEGLYFKVVDSDDWLDETALRKLINIIKLNHKLGSDVDLYLCNYVYEHTADNTQHPIHYKNVFPKNKVFGWKDVKFFRISQFLTMHAMTYRTALLRDCGLELPLHTFYVDNIFIMHPLPYVKTMYYLNVDMYRYFIGREDQSVNEEVLMRRIDQQARVALIMVDDYLAVKDKITSVKLDRYMIRHLGIISTIVSVFYAMKNTPESYADRKEFWKYIKKRDKKLCNRLRLTTSAGISDLPGKGGRFICLNGYKLTQKIYKYN